MPKKLFSRALSSLSKLSFSKQMETMVVSRPTPIKASPKTTFHVAKRSDIPAMANLIADTFLVDNSVFISLKLSKEELISHLIPLSEKVIDEELSVVAKTEEGKTVGAALVYDLYTDINEVYQGPILRKVSDLLEALDEKTKLTLDPPFRGPGNLGLVAYIASDPAHNSKGLFKKLSIYCMNVMSAKGFKI